MLFESYMISQCATFSQVFNRFHIVMKHVACYVRILSKLFTEYKTLVTQLLFTPKTLVKVLWYRVTGFFFNVVCCQVSTNNVHSYQLSCGLDYIALCHVIAYVCFFICSSLFI